MTLHLRALTDEERTKLERIVQAQTAPVRLARRARLVQLAAAGVTAPAIAVQVQQSEKGVRRWIARFDAAGLEGLDDAPRAGRPRTYPEDAYSRVIAKARGLPPKPADGEVPPTGHWTLDRLQAELAKEGLPIKRSRDPTLAQGRASQMAEAADLAGEHGIPDFAEKRVHIGVSTGRHRCLPVEQGGIVRLTGAQQMVNHP